MYVFMCNYAYSLMFMLGLPEKSCKKRNVAVAVRYENANEVLYDIAYVIIYLRVYIVLPCSTTLWRCLLRAYFSLCVTLT